MTECHWFVSPSPPSLYPLLLPTTTMNEKTCIMQSIVSSSLHPPFPPSVTALHLKKSFSLEVCHHLMKKKKCLPAIAMWPTFHPHIGPFLFHPSLPNGRVATAGECKCHPVLPVNYTTTKLIVCLVHTRKMPRSAIDGSIVSAQMQRFLFSQSRLNTD